MQSPVHDQPRSETSNGDDVHPVADETQASTSSEPIAPEEKDTNGPVGGENSSGNEQQIVHD